MFFVIVLQKRKDVFVIRTCKQSSKQVLHSF